MGISVNGVDIEDAAIEQAIQRFDGEGDALTLAIEQAILMELLRQRAVSLGLTEGDEAERLEKVLAQEVKVPEVDDVACLRWYEGHKDQFVVGALVEASHILFQVTDSVDLDALRGRAEDILTQLRHGEVEFAAMARCFSNCSSGEVGGSLGQLSRGDTVPEFEKVLFRLPAGEICPYLVESRFGLHILRVDRNIPGRQQSYEEVAEFIAEQLKHSVEKTALHQYLKLLAGQADIQGYVLESSSIPLVQ